MRNALRGRLDDGSGKSQHRNTPAKQETSHRNGPSCARKLRSTIGPSMKRISLLTLAAVIVTSISNDCLAAPLLPELLFKDTFDSGTPSDDINLDNAARQTGLLAPLTYTIGGNAPQLGQDGFAGVVKLNSDALLSPNMNFTFGRSFT